MNPTPTVGFHLRRVAKAKDQNTPTQQRDGTGGASVPSTKQQLLERVFVQDLENTFTTRNPTTHVDGQKASFLCDMCVRTFIDNSVSERHLSDHPVCVTLCVTLRVILCNPPVLIRCMIHPGLRFSQNPVCDLTRCDPVCDLTRCDLTEISVGLLASSSC